MIDFSTFMIPYAIISGIMVLTTTSLALQYVSGAAFAQNYPGEPQDTFWYYLTSALRIHLCTGVGRLLQRAAAEDSAGWSAAFLLHAVLAKYLLETLFLARFISTYSRLIEHHALRQANVLLDFEKSALQKKEMVEKSIFRGAADKRKELLRDKQKAETEARSSFLKERKGLRIMKGLEGRKLFTNALASVLSNTKRRQRMDSIAPPNITITEFSYRDPDTPHNRRISSITSRRKNRLISELAAPRSSERLPPLRSGLPMIETAELPELSDRQDRLATVETPRAMQEDLGSLLSLPQPHLHQRRGPTAHRQMSQLPPDLSSSAQAMNRSRSSNMSMILPNKGRLLRKLSMVKGVGRQLRPSVLVNWFGSPACLLVSTIFSIVLSVVTTLSFRPIACSGWGGFYPILSIFWVCNAYFSFEIAILVQ